MPRKPRTLISNASYHITSRGNQKQKVFLEDEDFKRFLHILRKYKKKFKFKLYAYCLMPTHVHLLLDPFRKWDLKKIMQGINLSYAQYFNYKYKKCGHLWQGRYLSSVVAKDSYILNCINYIEYNPVRAKLVDKPEDWPWSSYRARVLGVKDGLLDPVVL